MLNQRFFEKARLDPYYSSVINNFGESDLKESGFFDDGSALSIDMARVIDPNFLLTPLHKIKARLESPGQTNQPVAVLLTTGGFCPLHQGHVEMMESARSKLQEEGYFVAGGFFSPEHDEYVQRKCGKYSLSAEQRISIAEKTLKGSAWLAVDPWAALYLDRSVNFTDSIRRLQLYLNKHLTDEINVFYVCGADNYQFYKAFMQKGKVVIVPRSGHSLDLDYEKLKKSEIFIADKHLPNSHNSTALRETTEFKRKCYQSVRIYIRDEGLWAVKKWVEQYGPAVAEAKEWMQKELIELFKSTYASGYNCEQTEVTTFAVDSQHQKLGRLLQFSGCKAISLDPCTNADFNIAISRLFTAADSARLPGLYNRPGSNSLTEQISRIPEGTYSLIEDDIATGNTIKDILAMLPEQIKIKQVIALNQLESGHGLQTVEADSEDSLSDVVDLRDFIIGSKDAGLVIKLPDNSIVRAPYILPYVKNTSRMSLPESAERKLSESLWKLNYDFFIRSGDLIKVQDCSPEFQALASYLGFSDQVSMSEFCKWHIQQLAVGNKAAQ